MISCRFAVCYTLVSRSIINALLVIFVPLLLQPRHLPTQPNICQLTPKHHKRLLIIRSLRIHNVPLTNNPHPLAQIILRPHFLHWQIIYLGEVLSHFVLCHFGQNAELSRGGVGGCGVCGREEDEGQGGHPHFVALVDALLFGEEGGDGVGQESYCGKHGVCGGRMVVKFLSWWVEGCSWRTSRGYSVVVVVGRWCGSMAARGLVFFPFSTLRGLIQAVLKSQLPL